jgi:hypothetical protein
VVQFEKLTSTNGDN